MIAIIDYDAGNLMSVEKALDYLKIPNIVTRKQSEIMKADQIILPGVGAFGKAMEALKKHELDKILVEAAGQKPFLGICLGLQLLFSGSEENNGVEGLNLLQGDICRIPGGPTQKVPHMGWNSLQMKQEAVLYQGLPNEIYTYFIHSYYLKASDPAIVSATTEYGVTIHASVESENIFACQFHPEKSSAHGLAILRNFANLHI